MSAPFSTARLVGTYDSHSGLLPRERADLIRAGVPERALDEPSPIRAAYVVWTQASRFAFEQHEPPSARGQRAFVFLVEDVAGDPADIIAWQPATGRIGTWCGIAWGLGEFEALAPRMAEHDGLPVYRDPIDWLRADRRGVVILRPRLAADYLCDAGPLVAEDREHAAELDRVLTRRAPRILCPAVPHRRAA